MTAIREKFAKNFKKSKNAKNAEDNKKNKYLNTNLVQVLYIQYFIIFWEKFFLVLLNSRSDVNIIYLIFTKELGFSIRLIDIEILKIDNNMPNTYWIVVAAFLMTDKTNQVRFLKRPSW